MNIYFKYEFISWYFLTFLTIYVLVHVPLDLAMLLHKSGTRYPNPSFRNSFEKILVIVPSLVFWIYISIFPMISILLNFNAFIVINLKFLPKLIYGIIQIIGLSLMSYGLIIACFGRIGRGLYLRHNTPKLIKKGGFRIVRHPNYAFYIFNYIGILLLTTNLFLLLL
ncbi:MAG: DUF1295 domain-containing protein, partial [Promethearchaeota archaeon]